MSETCAPLPVPLMFASGVAEVAREALPVLAAAAVRHTDARRAGALLDDGPHERDVAALIAERFRRQVDRFEVLRAVDQLVVAFEPRLGDEFAGPDAQEPPDHVVLRLRVARDLDGADPHFAHRDVDLSGQVWIGSGVAVEGDVQTEIGIDLADGLKIAVEHLAARRSCRSLVFIAPRMAGVGMTELPVTTTFATVTPSWMSSRTPPSAPMTMLVTCRAPIYPSLS